MFSTDFRHSMLVTMEILRRGQTEMGRHDRALRVEGWGSPGIVVGRSVNGGLDERWLPAFSGGEVTITAPTITISSSLATGTDEWPLAPGARALSGTLYLVDSAGNLVELDTTVQGAVEIPDDGVWRTLIAKSATTNRERGTIAFTTGSTTVVGTNTRFTDLVDRATAGNYCSKLSVQDSANGNDGEYEVAEVVSDTELVVRAAPTGTTESGLAFSLLARVRDAASDEYEAFEREVVELELVSRTITSATGFVLADVKSTSGVGKVLDRRAGSLYAPATPSRGGLSVVPRFDAVTSAVETVQGFVTSSSADCYAMSGAPSSTGSLWAVERDGARVLDAVTLNHASNAAGSPVVISSTSGSGRPTIVQLCDGGDYTHLVVYHRSGVLYARRTADEGATWTGEATIWTPSAASSGATVTDPDAVRLLNGRIIVVAAHTTAAGLTTFRFITSDDQGATWSTNSNAGTQWIAQYSGATEISITAPRIAQGADGRIWTCWINSAGTVGWLVSADANQLARKLKLLGWYGGEITPYTSASKPDLVVGADGSAFVVWIDWSATSHTDVWGAPLIGDNPALARPRRLFRIDPGAGSSGQHHLHAYQGLDGVLLAYNTVAESVIAVNLVGADAIRTA